MDCTSKQGFTARLDMTKYGDLFIVQTASVKSRIGLGGAGGCSGRGGGFVPASLNVSHGLGMGCGDEVEIVGECVGVDLCVGCVVMHACMSRT